MRPGPDSRPGVAGWPAALAGATLALSGVGLLAGCLGELLSPLAGRDAGAVRGDAGAVRGDAGFTGPARAGVAAGVAGEAGAAAGGAVAARFAPPGQVPPETTGTLRLTVRWPPREAQAVPTGGPQSRIQAIPTGGPQSRIQAIPTTAQAIVVWVTKPDGVQAVAPVAVVREVASAATASATVTRIPEHPNLTVEARAYRGLDLATVPPAGTIAAQGTLVARAKKSGVAVRRGQETAERLTLLAQSEFVPNLGTMDTNAGRAGDTVTFSGGYYLAVQPGASLSVLFNGVAAPRIAPVSPTSIRAVVPAGATSGPVRVVNDNVRSLPENDPAFWVVRTFQVSFLSLPLMDGQFAGPGRVYYGGTLTCRADLVFDGVATGSQPPFVVWPAPPILAGTATFSLVADAQDSRTATLTAPTSYASGSVTALLSAVRANTLPAESVGVDLVILEPATLSLNARPASGSESASYSALVSGTLAARVFHTLPFADRGIEWTATPATIATADATRITTRADGAAEIPVTTLPDAPRGTVEIAAVSRTDRSKQATASVTVTVFGDLNVGVR